MNLSQNACIDKRITYNRAPMLRLRDDQWERIREHFPEEHIPEGRVGRNLCRRVQSWRRLFFRHCVVRQVIQVSTKLQDGQYGKSDQTGAQDHRRRSTKRRVSYWRA